jgi:hypothetical protein
MARELTPAFAKVVAQTAIGQMLHSHFGLSDELPPPFHDLLERMGREDVRRLAARYPVQTRAVSTPVDALSKAGVVGRPSKAAGVTSGDERKRKAAALLARAEEARSAADNMQAPDARESMLRIAVTYEKIARSMIKSTAVLKDATSDRNRLNSPKKFFTS